MLPHKFLLAALLAMITRAQQPNANSPELLTKINPVYPPIARAAHVSGTVTLDITIDTNGRVIDAKSVSGPMMLVGAATEAVKQWTYKPYLVNGVPRTNTARVFLNFDVPAPINPDDEAIAKQYFTAFDICIADFKNADISLGAASCGKAADIATQFSEQERFIERRSAYVYSASAYLRNRQVDRGLFYAEKAIAVVKQGHDDGSGSNAAYSIRAQAEAAIGNLTAADVDLTTAEDFERRAMIEIDDKQFVQHAYIPVLKQQLLFHARVLDALNNATAAAAKRAEAEKL